MTGIINETHFYIYIYICMYIWDDLFIIETRILNSKKCYSKYLNISLILRIDIEDREKRDIFLIFSVLFLLITNVSRTTKYL